MKEIVESINFTTVLSSEVVATIISLTQLIANRYTNRILDHIEKTLKMKKEEEKK